MGPDMATPFDPQMIVGSPPMPAAMLGLDDTVVAREPLRIRRCSFVTRRVIGKNVIRRSVGHLALTIDPRAMHRRGPKANAARSEPSRESRRE